MREILDNNQTPHDISPSGELLRAVGRARAERRRDIQLQSGADQDRSMSSEQDPDRRRQPHRHEQEASPLFVLPPNPSAETSSRDRPVTRYSSRIYRNRPTLSARTDRVRTALGENSANSSLAEFQQAGRRVNNGLADLQHAGRQLEQASSTLRALLDEPVPNIASPAMDPTAYSEEVEHNRRAKRRKVESDTLDSGFEGFSYGRYGQVEPGKLKMEIVSCDGGIFSEHGGNYAAENILRNDSTVYCTKSNRCNLVLRHQGNTVFNLKELVIKAPHAGYTAP